LYDVLIVGAGPAGLSAALVLGRCRKRVLVCDHGRPRNAASRGMHGYLSRDGIVPQEFLKIGREQLKPYPSVELKNIEVTELFRSEGKFDAMLADGASVPARKVLIATGVVDEIPRIKNMEKFYGMSVFHCPYCDGWEMRDAPLAVYGTGSSGCELSLKLLMWSKDIILLTDGPSNLLPDEVESLERHGIAIREERIDRLEGNDEGVLERIVFNDGTTVPRRGMFFTKGQNQHSSLTEALGCKLNEKGCVESSTHQATNVPGLYVAGDASEDMQMVVVAAAEGAKAAVAISQQLHQEDLEATQSAVASARSRS
jgi:thioredoxin reductase